MGRWESEGLGAASNRNRQLRVAEIGPSVCDRAEYSGKDLSALVDPVFRDLLRDLGCPSILHPLRLAR